MQVKVKLLGVNNRPVDGLTRFFYLYFLVAANGLIEETESEDYIEEGDYELPDEDWRFEDDEDLLGSTSPRGEGQRTKCEVCRTAASCWF